MPENIDASPASSSSSLRQTVWVAGFLLLLFLGWSYSGHSATQDVKVATTGYWKQMDFLRRQLIAKLPKDSFDQSIPNAIAHCGQNVAAYRDAARAVSEIPPQHVDPAIVELASKEIAFYNRAALMHETLQSWLKQVEGLKTHSESWGTMVESFMRGLGGDPFGKANDLLSEGDHLKVSFKSTVQPKIESLMVERMSLQTETSQLRLLLSQKYGTQLPQITDLPE